MGVAVVLGLAITGVVTAESGVKRLAEERRRWFAEAREAMEHREGS